jgi:6-pyruvoyltetrahydropterin/6-carboxytetrahydropterin synthase
MFEIRVEKTIACAHRLTDYNGPCEELHGHNYRIEVAYSGTELDRAGMLVDFGDIKKALASILGSLDHKYLNELPAFRDLSPSAENIARYIFLELKKTPLPGGGALSSVAVWETPTQVAIYRES